jgi:hypothetical protein
MPTNLNLDYYRFGLPALLCVVALILYAQVLVKRRLGAATIHKCHEVGGYYLSLVGTFYAVLLGLVVVDAMNKFQQAETTVDKEATALLKIYSSAERFPENRQMIESLVTSYRDEVVHREFELMAYGRTSEIARTRALELLRTIKRIEPVSENQKAIYPGLLSEISDFWDARRERISNANFGEPVIEWIVLIAGALITIALTFFFTIDSDGIHLIMRGMATIIIFMGLYLTFLFSSPFSGDLRVSSQPFDWIEGYARADAATPSPTEPAAPQPAASHEPAASHGGAPPAKARAAKPGAKSEAPAN